MRRCGCSACRATRPPRPGRSAQAVEISSSTVFAYFPVKEDLVLTDEYDPAIIATIRTLPPDADPARAVRGGPGALSGILSADELAGMCQRTELALSVPELRATMLDQLVQLVRVTRRITGIVAERRAGRRRLRGPHPWPGQSSGS